ncbi:MAG: 5-formyltetrahydrofolate cyclo-ligase [Burkholderiaceae bacterium]
MHNKSELRRHLIAERIALDEAQRLAWDNAIALHVQSILKARGIKSLGVYWPIRGEPDLQLMYEELASHGTALALPKVDTKNAPLSFVAWTPGEALKKDAYGTFTPDKPSMAGYPEALLIPCVGFTKKRMRLGYGAGYYDRTLAIAPRPYAIGVGYSCALTEFQSSEYDIALDVIATEQAYF